jgi:hypothetical protein
MRSLVNKVFTPRAIEAMRPMVTETIDRYLAKVDRSRFDVVQDFSAFFPVEVITQMLGVPEIYRQQVREWVDTSLHREPGQIDMSEKGMQAIGEAMALYYKLIQERRANPCDDMFSRLVAAEIERAQRLSVFEGRPAPLQDVLLLFEFRVAARLLQIALETLEAPFDDAKVGKDQLVLHRAHVTRRIDGSRRVRHRGIAKHADHVQERVGVAERSDVEQRRGTRLRAGCAAHVGELDGGRHVLLRVEQRRQAIEAIVGHAGDADVRFLFAAGAGGFAGAGEQLKESSLARRRESNEAGSQHGRSAHASTALGEPLIEALRSSWLSWRLPRLSASHVPRAAKAGRTYSVSSSDSAFYR